jgi:hypothetical protein
MLAAPKLETGGIGAVLNLRQQAEYWWCGPGLLSPVRNARISASFVVEALAGTRYELYSSF